MELDLNERSFKDLEKLPGYFAASNSRFGAAGVNFYIHENRYIYLLEQRSREIICMFETDELAFLLDFLVERDTQAKQLMAEAYEASRPVQLNTALQTLADEIEV